MRSAQSGDCVLPPAGAKRCEANHRKTEGEHWTQCARVRRRREEHTLIQRQSWGLSNDSELRMVNWESQSKTLLQSPEEGHIYRILLIRIVFCHMSKNLSIHCLFYVTMSIYFCFYFNIARDVVMVLLILVDVYHFDSHFHTHIQRHIHTNTHK